MAKNTASTQVQTDLFFAIKNKKLDKVRWMMKKGADYFVNMELPGSNLNFTPLILSVKMSSSCAIPNILFEAGAEADITDKLGRTALSYAAEEKKSALVKMLLDRSSDPYLSDSSGVTPWMYALKSNCEEVLDSFSEYTSENLPDIKKTKFVSLKQDSNEKENETESKQEENDENFPNPSYFTKTQEEDEQEKEDDLDSDEEFYRRLRDDEIDTCFLFSK